jgi:hypothetical protein
VVPEKAVHVRPGTFGSRVKVPAAARRAQCMAQWCNEEHLQVPKPPIYGKMVGLPVFSVLTMVTAVL